MSTTGACEADSINFCKDVVPGEGRLAECLTKQQQEEDNGNVDGARA